MWKAAPQQNCRLTIEKFFAQNQSSSVEDPRQKALKQRIGRGKSSLIKKRWPKQRFFGTGFACENHQNDINPPLLSKNGGRIYKIWTENSSKTASVPHRTVLKWLLSIKISSRLQKLCIKSHKFPTIRGKGEIGQKIIFQRHNYILWY